MGRFARPRTYRLREHQGTNFVAPSHAASYSALRPKHFDCAAVHRRGRAPTGRCDDSTEHSLWNDLHDHAALHRAQQGPIRGSSDANQVLVRYTATAPLLLHAYPLLQ
jgi:hypothetical protein